MHRRRFLLGATMGAVSTLAGCLGGESGRSNNSSNGNGGGETTSGGVSKVDAFAGKTQFEGRNLLIPIASDADIDKVQANNANGQKWGTYNMQRGETTAKFKLVKKEPGTRFKSYPFGRWGAFALKDGEVVDEGGFDMRPDFRPVSTSAAESGTVDIELKNVGTGPAALGNARLYKVNADPRDDEGWTLGTETKTPELVLPDESAIAPANPFGFTEAYGAGAEETATTEDLCSGESYEAILDYKLFGEIYGDKTVTVSFSGGRKSDIQVAGINCETVALESTDSTESDNSTASA